MNKENSSSNKNSDTLDNKHCSSEDCTNGLPSPCLIVSFILLIFWAGFYLAFYSGGFLSDVYENNLVNWKGAKGISMVEKIDRKDQGKKLYTQNCMICHQATGEGNISGTPPLAKSDWIIENKKHGINHLILILLDGFQGNIDVLGKTYNSSMPSWKQLSDDDLTNIIAYIRSAWNNNQPEIPIDYVAQIRKKYLSRTDAWSVSELLAIPPNNILDQKSVK